MLAHSPQAVLLESGVAQDSRSQYLLDGTSPSHPRKQADRDTGAETLHTYMHIDYVCYSAVLDRAFLVLRTEKRPAPTAMKDKKPETFLGPC